VAYHTLDVLVRASLTLGLLCVGARLELGHISRERQAAAAITAALKLLAVRAATALACRIFRVDRLTAAAAVLFTACPISASELRARPPARGDATLLAGLITITTIAALASLPLVLALLT
jgi:malonate transporter and related proteins